MRQEKVEGSLAGIAGSFIGLVVGGLLGPVEWHLVFLVSVPFGLFGTFWAYLKLRELGERRPVNLDWWGNLTFGVVLIALLAGITYDIQPYGGHIMGSIYLPRHGYSFDRTPLWAGI
jgi:hypothetical protein